MVLSKSRSKPPSRKPRAKALPLTPELSIARDPKIREYFASRFKGKYELFHAVACGGLSNIIRAKESETGREVALKVPRVKAKISKRLYDTEARALRRLDHPNVVKLYDVGQIEGDPYLVLEYLSGTNLELMEYPSLNHLLGIFTECCDALTHIHRRGVIHRDVKPGNIMHTEDGRTVLLDFQLARISLIWDYVLHSQGSAGTMHFLAPEQTYSMPGRIPDPRTDVFSLGASMYITIANFFGRYMDLYDYHACGAGTREQMFQLHRLGTPIPLHERIPEVPQVLSELIQKALQNNPVDRYQGAVELKKAILEFCR